MEFYSLTREQIENLVHCGAGIGSGAVMQLAPKVVMPTEEIITGCDRLLGEFFAANEDRRHA